MQHILVMSFVNLLLGYHIELMILKIVSSAFESTLAVGSLSVQEITLY